MKKLIFILTLSLLTLVSCDKNKHSYYDVNNISHVNTFSFEEEEIEIQITDEMTSFFINGSRRETENDNSFITVEHSESTAKHRKHYLIPRNEYYYTYGYEFPAGELTTKFEVEVYPNEIKEPLVITFYNRSSYYKEENTKDIDRITVTLIPKAK